MPRLPRYVLPGHPQHVIQRDWKKVTDLFFLERKGASTLKNKKKTGSENKIR